MIWLLLILFIHGGLNQAQHIMREWQQETIFPCDGSRITVGYVTPLPERQNQYNLDIDPLPTDSTTLILKFDSEASLELKKLGPSKFRGRLQKLAVPKNSFRVLFFGNPPRFNVQVFGPATGKIPYVQSILADYKELCKDPKIGYFDEYIIEEEVVFEEIVFEEEKAAEKRNLSVDESCGRRKAVQTELVVHGQPTKSGDWPWHVAISQIEKSDLKYICGGTLLAKTLVLTAAHCASIRGNAIDPDALSVDLGTHNFISGDIGAQKIKVFEVIIHPKFNGITLNNDIALLMLKSEAVFSDYVQPACLWDEQSFFAFPVGFGTVVGWGYDKDLLSSSLQQITIPIVSDSTCLKSNPKSFNRKLLNNKLCAGFATGTSTCYGDSGGGLMIFVFDTVSVPDKASGVWYIRGVGSFAPSRTDDAKVCDPHQYTIFTDVQKYREWLSEYLF